MSVYVHTQEIMDVDFDWKIMINDVKVLCVCVYIFMYGLYVYVCIYVCMGYMCSMYDDKWCIRIVYVSVHTYTTYINRKSGMWTKPINDDKWCIDIAYVYMYVLHLCVCLSTHKSLCVCVYIYIYIHTHNIYIYIYTHIYIHRIFYFFLFWSFLWPLCSESLFLWSFHVGGLTLPGLLFPPTCGWGGPLQGGGQNSSMNFNILVVK